LDIFNNSKYTKIYFSIVTRARERVILKEGYYERHHIIPGSMGGSNNKDNLVKLTAKEHYVCHWLLVKMTSGENLMKAWAGLRLMVFMDPTGKGKRSNSIRITSRLFEELRTRHAERTGIRVKAMWNDPIFRDKCNMRTTEERRAAAMKAVTPEVSARKRASALGRLHSVETRAKMSATRIEKYGSTIPKRVEGPKWIITSPTGEQYKINHLNYFCKEHSLHAPTLTVTSVSGLPVPPHHAYKYTAKHRANTTGWLAQKCASVYACRSTCRASY